MKTEEKLIFYESPAFSEALCRYQPDITHIKGQSFVRLEQVVFH